MILKLKWALHLNESEFKKSVPAIFRHKFLLNFETNPVIFRATVGTKNVPRWKLCFWDYLMDNFLIMINDSLKILSYSNHIDSYISWNFHWHPLHCSENQFLRGRVPLTNPMLTFFKMNIFKCFVRLSRREEMMKCKWYWMNKGRDDATSHRFKKSGDQKYLFSVIICI